MSQGKIFEYQTNVKWTGALSGELSSSGLSSIPFGAPVDFGGTGGQWTPEQMLVASVEACTLMTFLAYAGRRGVKLVAYGSSARATLGRDTDGVMRFTSLVIQPVVRVEDEDSATAARELLAGIARKCFVGSSLIHEPRIEATVEVAPSASAVAAG
ncbi:MAG TPA: OsmC family protein [Myxococcaceae bacterium]|nr:OsmC family protein [Myxococcaceae bacterium]